MPSLNHLKDILHDKNHLYRIVLVHLTSNDAFKTREHLQMAGYGISKFRLIADHICKPRCQTKHRTGAILWHNNKFTSEMCLLRFRQVWHLCTSLFLLCSIRLFFFFFINLIIVLIFQSTLSSVSRCYNIYFKALALL